jgi:hypothetical protein
VLKIKVKIISNLFKTILKIKILRKIDQIASKTEEVTYILTATVLSGMD